MQKEHTPGPWKVYVHASHRARAGQPSSIGQDDEAGLEADEVCELLPIDMADTKTAEATEWANARLIAKSPDLLARCRELIDILWRYSGVVHPLQPKLIELLDATRKTVQEATSDHT